MSALDFIHIVLESIFALILDTSRNFSEHEAVKLPVTVSMITGICYLNSEHSETE